MSEIEWDWYAAEYQINIKIREGKGQKDKKWINLFKSTKLNFYASSLTLLYHCTVRWQNDWSNDWDVFNVAPPHAFA